MNARYITLLAAMFAALSLPLSAATPASGNSSTVPSDPFSLPADALPAASAPAPMVSQSTPSAPAAMAPTAHPSPSPATAATAPVAPTASPDPVVGDSLDTVLKWNRPNGQIGLPDGGYLLMFDRGNILLSPERVVTEVKLQPLAQYQAVQAAESEQQAEAEANRVRTNALLDTLLNDPVYRTMSTRDRITALEKFNRENPGSDAPQDIKDLLAIYQAEMVVQSHINQLSNQAQQAQNQTEMLRKQIADYQKLLNEANQRAQANDEKSAQASAQQQASRNQTPQSPIPAQQSGPKITASPAGIVITAPGGN